jgi:hypothetical protein
MSRNIIAFVAGALLTAIAAMVMWPSSYSYYSDSKGNAYRVHRITAERELATARGWKSEAELRQEWLRFAGNSGSNGQSPSPLWRTYTTGGK